jgi:hypothetical protein
MMRPNKPQGPAIAAAAPAAERQKRWAGHIDPCSLAEVLEMKAKLFRALLLTPVVAMVDWQVMVFSWWYIVWLGFPLVGVGMLFAGRLRSRPSRAAVGVALIVSGVIGGSFARYLNLNQVKANQSLGEQVAAAIKDHRDARGNYPESLEDLVPNFLARLPVPSVGVLASPWYYTQSEQVGSFVLGYRAMAGAALFYEKGKWSAVPFPW